MLSLFVDDIYLKKVKSKTVGLSCIVPIFMCWAIGLFFSFFLFRKRRNHTHTNTKMLEYNGFIRIRLHQIIG